MKVKDKESPNPYRLRIVPFSEVDKDYYTMSSNGITLVRSDGHSGTSYVQINSTSLFLFRVHLNGRLGQRSRCV